MRRRGPRPSRLALGVLAIAVVAAGLWREAAGPEGGADGASAVADLYESRRSGVVVEGSGIVANVLSDDRDGSPHQRFVLRLETGQTVLVAHNIDLAPRIESPGRGDAVSFRGQYEWNERGGVLHWTHHDPDGTRPGGWLRHGERTYR